jgi:hypothetical protein
MLCISQYAPKASKKIPSKIYPNPIKLPIAPELSSKNDENSKARYPTTAPKRVRTNILGKLNIIANFALSFQEYLLTAIYETIPGAHTIAQTEVPLIKPNVNADISTKAIRYEITKPPI